MHNFQTIHKEEEEEGVGMNKENSYHFPRKFLSSRIRISQIKKWLSPQMVGRCKESGWVGDARNRKRCCFQTPYAEYPFCPPVAAPLLIPVVHRRKRRRFSLFSSSDFALNRQSGRLNVCLENFWVIIFRESDGGISNEVVSHQNGVVSMASKCFSFTVQRPEINR